MQPTWAREHELFIFYWIAFNALYGARGETEEPKLEDFFKKVEIMAAREDGEGVSTLRGAISDCLIDGATVIRDKFLDEAYRKNTKHEKDVVEECQTRYDNAEKALTGNRYRSLRCI